MWQALPVSHEKYAAALNRTVLNSLRELKEERIRDHKENKTMKLIIAYIRPEMLNAVKQALYAKEIYSLSVTNVLGSGRQKGFTETYRGV